MTAEHSRPDLERLDLAAAAKDQEGLAPKRPRGLEVSQITAELHRQREERYGQFIERVYGHWLRDELDDEGFQRFWGQLRGVGEKELDEAELGRLFDETQPTLPHLRAIVHEIEERFGQKVTRIDSDYPYVIREGKLSGCFEVAGRWLPVIDNRPVTEVVAEDGKTYTIHSANQIFLTSGGWAASVETNALDNFRKLPIWQGRLQQTIEGRMIQYCEVSDATEAGWSGWVRFDEDEESPQIPVHNGKLVGQIEGQPEHRSIQWADAIHDHEGQLSGIVGFVHTGNPDAGVIRRLVQGGKIVERIGELEDITIRHPGRISFQVINGEEVINGEVQVPPIQGTSGSGWESRVVIRNHFVEQLDGMTFYRSLNIEVDDQERASGIICPPSTSFYSLPLFHGRVLTEIEEEQIYGCWAMQPCDDGTWNGLVGFGGPDGPLFPVWHGQLVRTWKGQKVKFHHSTDIHELAGTLNGWIVYKDANGALIKEELVLAPPPEVD